MKKKSFLVFYTFIMSFFLYSIVPQFDLLNEAKTLSEKEYQVGGKVNCKLNPLLLRYENISDMDNFLLLSYAGYLNNQGFVTAPITYLMTPTAGMEFNARFGIKEGLEIGLNVGVTSPPYFDLLSVACPDIILDFNLKKEIVKQDGFSFSYKFLIGNNATVMVPGVDFVIKNSFMVGIDKQAFSFNIIPSIQTGIFAGQFVYQGIFWSMTPEIEMNFNVYFSKFIFIAGISTNYEVVFMHNVPQNSVAMMHELNITLSTGFAFRDKK
jgi:hypothetical protein